MVDAPPRPPPPARTLPFRLGVLGAPEDDDATYRMAPVQRYARAFDFLAGHGLAAWGFDPLKTPLLQADVEAIRSEALANGIQTHCVLGPHPPMMHSYPAPEEYAAHARSSIHARWATQAAKAGCLTYTIFPPRHEEGSLEDFLRELGLLQDRLRLEGVGIHLHVGTPPSARHHLHDVAVLRDFARDSALGLTIHAGYLYGAQHKDPGLDGWKDLVQEAPSGTLYCYANFDAERNLVQSFVQDSYSTPRAVPLLQALVGLPDPGTTLLVQGGRNDTETHEILVNLAHMVGIKDLGLVQRAFRFPHRRTLHPYEEP